MADSAYIIIDTETRKVHLVENSDGAYSMAVSASTLHAGEDLTADVQKDRAVLERRQPDDRDAA